MNQGQQTEFFTNNPWLIVLAVIPILIVIGIVLWVYYRHLCKKLIGNIEYKREFSDFGVYEGDTVTITETLYNNTKLPLFNIYAESYIFPELQLTAYTYKDKKAMQLFQSKFSLVMPYMQVKRKHKIICTKRGKYELESAEIILPGSSRFVESRSVLYVYPAILPAPVNPYPVGLLMGESISRRMLVRDPFSISGIRPYAQGDPFNLINFKATAKAYGTAAQPLRVNNLDYCSNRTFMVYINFQTNPKEPIPSHIFNKMMENSLSYTADIIRVMSENGYRLGLKSNCVCNDGTNGIDFPVHSGELHVREMLCAMSEIRIASSVSFSSLISKDARQGLSDTEIFIFTSYTDDDTESAIEELKKNRNSVNIVLPFAEDEKEESENEE
ncbi:MAG: DUF58 domain-containing protein [Clostridia bacterium]|nr:DUF58 domain-containing protein [Clostridia bacterium]